MPHASVICADRSGSSTSLVGQRVSLLLRKLLTQLIDPQCHPFRLLVNDKIPKTPRPSAVGHRRSSVPENSRDRLAPLSSIPPPTGDWPLATIPPGWYADWPLLATGRVGGTGYWQLATGYWLLGGRQIPTFSQRRTNSATETTPSFCITRARWILTVSSEISR